MTETCWACLGKGTVDRGGASEWAPRCEPCPECHGEGVLDVPQRSEETAK